MSDRLEASHWFKDDFPLTFAPSHLHQNVPPHTHDFWELVIFQQGGAIHTVYNGDNIDSYPVIPGDCFIIHPEEQHALKIGDSAMYYNILFSNAMLENTEELRQLDGWEPFFAKNDPTRRPKIHLNMETRAWINSCAQHLSQELMLRKPGYQTASKALFWEILLVLLRNKPVMINPKERFLPDESLLAVISRMEQSLSCKSTLAEMAKNAHACVSGFAHKFRLIMGMSPGEYLLTLRLGKAATLLKESGDSLAQIAAACGFYDANYLIKTFSQRYGMTPGRYRAAHKQIVDG